MNVRHVIGMVCIAAVAVGLAGCNGTGDGPSADDGAMGGSQREFFSVGVEQNRQPIPAGKDPTVTLEKKPFSLVFFFREEDAVLVNVSAEPTNFRAAVEGKPLARIPGFSGGRIREGRFNEDQSITLSDNRHHFWYHYSRGNTKFDKTAWVDGLLVTRRKVARYAREDAQPVDIRNFPGKDLYFVFVKAEWNENRTALIERQRKVLHVKFR